MLVYRITKYPLTVMERKQYKLLIVKFKDNEQKVIYDIEDMELDVVLRNAIKFMETYKQEHKNYNVFKGGGDYI